MSNTDDVANALAILRTSGAQDVALLHCVSAYPVPHDSQNLRAITDLARSFQVPVGLSDHGTDPTAIMLAVALGATIYEKHFMLSDQTDAIDAAVSATPDRLAALIVAAESARIALGHGRKECLPAESVNVSASRRSLYAARALRAGDIVTAEAVVALRPSTGLHPRFASALIGQCLRRDVPAGSAFLETDLDAVKKESARHVA
jgi:sialic acid synthase SpsE